MVTYAYWKLSGPTSDSDLKTSTFLSVGAARATAKRATKTMRNFMFR